jgi:sec-independent protein translocase protein TatC
MTVTSKRPRLDGEEDPQPRHASEMSLVDHLTELRSRLIRAALGIVVGMVASFWVVDDIIRALARLAEPYTLQSIGVTENFSTFLKVSFVVGLALSMPIIVYQLLSFISPGLTARERRAVLTAIPFIMLLFLVGLGFGYLVALPAAVRFLLGFGPNVIVTQPRYSDFVGFVTNLLLWVGVTFEMPVIVYTLIKTNIVSAQRLAGMRRYAFLVILVAAAIITPTPDPGNMLIVAAPMYLLFELGILLGRTF